MRELARKLKMKLVEIPYYTRKLFFASPNFCKFHFFASLQKLILQKYCHATPFFLSTWIICENIFAKYFNLPFSRDLATQNFSSIQYSFSY